MSAFDIPSEPQLPDSTGWERFNPPEREPVPVCPECGGLLRRYLAQVEPIDHAIWRCDQHGFVSVEWVYPEEDTDRA